MRKDEPSLHSSAPTRGKLSRRSERLAMCVFVYLRREVCVIARAERKRKGYLCNEQP